MADGIIAVNDNSNRVGEVRWTGVLSRGQWIFVPAALLPDARRVSLVAMVEELPHRYPWLRALHFHGPRDALQLGWTGFAGTLGALRVVLPHVGLRVDEKGVRWVRTIGRSEGDEVRLPDSVTETARALALDQWEMIRLQAEARRNG